MAAFRLKRIYERPSEDDGYRILVDRLWPRGLKKEAAMLDEWNREIAPSDELRKWFGHQPGRFEAFAEKYAKELEGKPGELDRLREIAKKRVVCLLYAAKEPDKNNAVVLLKVISSLL